MLKIGDFSKFTYVTVKTLRYYDEIGLLEPTHIDPFTHYRYYSVEQIPRLNRILALKELGLSLEQIGRLLNDQEITPEEIRGMLRLKQAEIEQTLRQEQTRLARVEARLQQIEQEHTMTSYDVITKTLPAQTVAGIREVVETYFAQGPLWSELATTLHQSPAKLCGPPMTIYYDNEYKERDVDTHVATPIQQPFAAEGRITIEPLPGFETAACVVHQGDYATLSNAYTALLRWIEQNNYQIAGPNREIYLRCPGHNPTHVAVYQEYTTDNPSEYLTELQFPVVKQA